MRGRPRGLFPLQVMTKLEYAWHLYYHPFRWCGHQGQTPCLSNIGDCRLIGSALHFVIGDKVVLFNSKEHMEAPLVDSIGHWWLPNLLNHIRKKWQYTGVVKLHFHWERDSWLQVLVQALHQCAGKCTVMEDVWCTLSCWVDESTKVDKFLYCCSCTVMKGAHPVCCSELAPLFSANCSPALETVLQ